jgi:CheY-like chemotaxis protein
LERRDQLTNNRKTLLWVDDDGEERFLYEKYNLEKRGWRITWAFTVREAAMKLAEDSYDAVLLDQMLPPRNNEDEPSFWGGCALLYWLRGGGRLQDTRDFDFVADFIPRPHNQIIRVTLVSAFYDDQVMSYVVNAPGPAVELVRKPIDLSHLVACLEGSSEK